MKHFSILIFLFVSVSGCFAQIPQSTILLGADANYHTTTREYTYGDGRKAPGDIKTNTISAQPTIAFFIANNIAIGLNFGYSYTRNKNSFNFNNIDDKTRIVEIGPYVRLYKMLGEQAGIFAQAEFNYGKGLNDYRRINFNNGTPISGKDDIITIDAGIKPGFVFFITKRIGLETSIGFLGYQSRKAGNDEMNLNIDNTTKSFGLSLNPSSVNVGFRYYIIR
jgi:hypothetical protein